MIHLAISLLLWAGYVAIVICNVLPPKSFARTLALILLLVVAFFSWLDEEDDEEHDKSKDPA